MLYYAEHFTKHASPAYQFRGFFDAGYDVIHLADFRLQYLFVHRQAKLFVRPLDLHHITGIPVDNQ